MIEHITTTALPYLISRPAENISGARPVLCFLHGYDEGAPNNIRKSLTSHGPLRAGNPAFVAGEFIVVAPQLPLCGDLWRRYQAEVTSIVQHVQETCHGDRERTYLTGFSFGGNGVFEFGLTQPDIWAALWAVDPTRVPPVALTQPVWLSFGEVARRQKVRFVEVLGPASDDRRFVDEGADHVGAATLAYRDRMIYEWLLRHRLGTRQK